jgi:radical SAM protein with 4Fe4S-binding SPASM domain
MECMQIPLVSYTEFGKRLSERIDGRRFPLSGSIELTERCNLRCVHCYINRSRNDKQAKESELTTKQLYKIVDEIVAEGCLWLLLTGGEPFIREDFLDVYTYAKQKGLIITIFTNGTVVTPRLADYLSEWRPHAIELTLYGRTQQTYEKVTRISGSYEKCMRGIHLIIERKLPLKLKAMIHSLNRTELWEMKSFAENLNVDFRFDPVVNLRLDGNAKPTTLRISPEEIVAIDLVDSKRKREWEDFCRNVQSSVSSNEYLYQCGAGLNTFHIDSYGKLSPCIMARNNSYDLLRGTFREGWQDFLPHILSQKWSQESSCRDCKICGICEQCPGVALNEHGNPESPVEYLCQIAHKRAEAFGFHS